MQTLHNIILYAHILFGSAALLLFWVPMMAAKGRLNHVKFGRFYNWAMYSVAASGGITALIVIWDPILIHGERLSNPDNASIFIDKMRVFYGLLFYLSVLIYSSLRHGILVLKHKHEPAQLKRTDLLASNGLLFFGSPILFYFGLQFDMKLPLIFSILGLVAALGNIKYTFTQKMAPKAWLREHIGALIGTGIGAYTAFFAFGGRAMFGDIGNWQLIFWVGPGVIGSFAIRYYCLKYAPAPKNTLKNAPSLRQKSQG